MNEEAVDRVVRALPPGTLDALDALPGADLTTAMLEIARRRADRLSPAEVLARYGRDRFVRPGTIAPDRIRRAIGDLTARLPPDAEEIALSPLVPIGTHGLAGVAQPRVITTERATEVAADPTNALALEVAARRRMIRASAPRSATRITLAGSQRVVRAQVFRDAAAFSHFELFGLVTGGRDAGSFAFERETLVRHLRFVLDALAAATGDPSAVRVTDLTDGRMRPVIEEVRDTLGAERVGVDPDRIAGRGYYDAICFKGYAIVGGEPFEVADGGFVDWTQLLLADRKERLLITGIGVERLAIARDARSDEPS